MCQKVRLWYILNWKIIISQTICSYMTDLFDHWQFGKIFSRAIFNYSAKVELKMTMFQSKRCRKLTLRHNYYLFDWNKNSMTPCLPAVPNPCKELSWKILNCTIFFSAFKFLNVPAYVDRYDINGTLCIHKKQRRRRGTCTQRSANVCLSDGIDSNGIYYKSIL